MSEKDDESTEIMSRQNSWKKKHIEKKSLHYRVRLNILQ